MTEEKKTKKAIKLLIKYKEKSKNIHCHDVHDNEFIDNEEFNEDFQDDYRNTYTAEDCIEFIKKEKNKFSKDKRDHLKDTQKIIMEREEERKTEINIYNENMIKNSDIIAELSSDIEKKIEKLDINEIEFLQYYSFLNKRFPQNVPKGDYDLFLMIFDKIDVKYFYNNKRIGFSMLTNKKENSLIALKNEIEKIEIFSLKLMFLNLCDNFIQKSIINIRDEETLYLATF